MPLPLQNCRSYLSKDKGFFSIQAPWSFLCLQCYQVTSHRHQEGPYQTDDAKLQKEGGRG